MTYSRSELKKLAKGHLKGSFWQGFGVVFANGFIKASVLQLLSLIFSTFLSSMLSLGLFSQLTQPQMQDISELFRVLAELEKALVPTLLIYSVQSGFAILLSLFLFNHLRTGSNLWFLRNRERTTGPQFSMLFNNLKKENYWGTFLGMAWRDFWYAIWSLPGFLLQIGMSVLIYLGFRDLIRFFSENYQNYQLESLFTERYLTALSRWWWLILVVIILSILFSIIRLIKKYHYLPAEWLLADNPDLGYREALRLSKKMVKGYKWKWFVLDLSFLGWYILMILFALFIFFLRPLLQTYINATYAEFYSFLREEAVQNGLVRYEDLGFVKVSQKQDYIPTASEFYNR